MEFMASGRKRPPEFRERAIRMLREWREQRGRPDGGFPEVALQLGIHTETLRNWVRQDDVDNGVRPGVSSEDKDRIAALERENRELRRANEILKTAASFFARELDPRPPR